MNEYVVAAASPPMMALVVETCVACAPFWKTRYCTEQLAPGLEAFQERVTLLLVWLGEASPVGTVGRVLHAALLKLVQFTLKAPASMDRRMTCSPAVRGTPVLVTVVQFCQPPVAPKVIAPVTFCPSISTWSVPPALREATRTPIA